MFEDVGSWYPELNERRNKWVIKRNDREVLYEQWGENWYMLEFDSQGEAQWFIDQIRERES